MTRGAWPKVSRDRNLPMYLLHAGWSTRRRGFLILIDYIGSMVPWGFKEVHSIVMFERFKGEALNWDPIVVVFPDATPNREKIASADAEICEMQNLHKHLRQLMDKIIGKNQQKLCVEGDMT